MDEENKLIVPEVIDVKGVEMTEGNFLSRNRSKVIAGIVGVTIFIGGGIATAHYKPFARNQATVASGVKVASVDPVATPTDATQIVEASTPTAYTNNMVLPDPTQNGGYRIKTEMPPGFYVYGITFHQGFRPAGLQAVDVHILARSHANENELVEGRDEIVSITGTSGKTYNMIGTKRTGVNTNAYSDTYQEQEITEYQDVSEKETDIVSVSIRRDGKIYTIKPDEDTKHDTTYPPKATTKATTTTTTATPAKATPAFVTPAKTTPTPTPGTTIGTLTIIRFDNLDGLNRKGTYTGEIVDGKANGKGTVRWEDIPGAATDHTFTGTFKDNAPYGSGRMTCTNGDGIPIVVDPTSEGLT